MCLPAALAAGAAGSAASAATAATAASAATTASAISSFIGAHATAFSVGTSILSAFGTEYAARQAGKAQKRAIEANSRGVALDAASQYNARSLALQNEQEAVAVERERLARETRTMVGSQALASVEAGVGGASADDLLADFETLGAMNDRNLQRGLELSEANFAAETNAIYTRANNQINSFQTDLSNPSLLRFVLNAGVGAVDGITKYSAPQR